VAAHDAEHGGEAEPASGKFGGEEGIEDAGECFFAHAAAIVADFDENVIARGQVVGELHAIQILGIDTGNAGGE